MSNYKVTREKNCYCHTCDKDFHYLGIAKHRAMHRDRKEDCKITFTHGDTLTFRYSKKVISPVFKAGVRKIG